MLSEYVGSSVPGIAVSNKAIITPLREYHGKKSAA